MAAEPPIDTEPTNTPDTFSYKTATFDEVLEDLSSRFILNLPENELAEVERVCFQIEQAHWYYEDFIREENKSFPSLALKKFSEILFRACPLLHHWSNDHEAAFNDFMSYKTRVPVCGAIMLNASLTKCVLVKGWKSSAGWGFPKGKVNENEDEALCAVREVLEETGYSLSGQIQRELCVRLNIKEQPVTLFVVPGIPEEYCFKTQTRKEIGKIDWFKLSDLPTWKKNGGPVNNKFYLITPAVGPLKAIVRQLRQSRKSQKSEPLRAQDPYVSPAPSNSEPENDRRMESYALNNANEAEASSSQSSSIEPHTPSTQSELAHVPDEMTRGTQRELESIYVQEHGVEMDGPITVKDHRAHWQHLMSRLDVSDDNTSDVLFKSFPEPPASHAPSSARTASPSPTSTAEAKQGTPSSATETPDGMRSASTMRSPQPPSPDTLSKHHRRLRLLASVLNEAESSLPPLSSPASYGSFPHPPAPVPHQLSSLPPPPARPYSVLSNYASTLPPRNHHRHLSTSTSYGVLPHISRTSHTPHQSSNGSFGALPIRYRPPANPSLPHYTQQPPAGMFGPTQHHYMESRLRTSSAVDTQHRDRMLSILGGHQTASPGIVYPPSRPQTGGYAPNPTARSTNAHLLSILNVGNRSQPPTPGYMP